MKLVKLCAEGLAAVKAEQEMDSILGVLLQTGTEVCISALELEGLPILYCIVRSRLKVDWTPGLAKVRNC